MSHADRVGRRTFRNPASVAVVIGVGVAAAVLSLAAAASAAGVVSAAVVAAFTIRAAFAAVVATPEGLVVRNPLRTHRLAWTDVAAFEVGQSGRYPGTPLARRTRGRPVVLWAVRDIANMVKGEPVYARRVVEDLNALLHSERATG